MLEAIEFDIELAQLRVPRRSAHPLLRLVRGRSSGAPVQPAVAGSGGGPSSSTP